MRMASVILSVIAHAKQQSEIQLGDVVAGIHVACLERLLPFWPSAAAFEDFVGALCGGVFTHRTRRRADGFLHYMSRELSSAKQLMMQVEHRPSPRKSRC
jgi:hypothetical protein